MVNKNLILYLSTVARDVKQLDLLGETIDIHQTNESVIYNIIKQTNGDGSFNKIYALCSNIVLNNYVEREDLSDCQETHFEYLKNRVLKFCQERNFKAPEIIPIKMEEDLNQKDNSTSLFSIFKLVQEMDDISAEVFVDITGGFRTSSMVLLTIMRLLEYKNIKIYKVLYALLKGSKIANIEDVTKIYTNYNIIAAAEEFVKFGSVKSLKEFYNNTESKHIKNLLECMNDFSEAMKLCIVSRFQGILNNLKSAIDEFKQNQTNSEDDMLFNILIEKIEDDYKSIIEQSYSDEDVSNIPNIIKWCTERGFMQQALTLYVEKIPKYIVNEGLIYPTEDSYEDIKKEFISKHNSSYQDWEYYFLNNYLMDKYSKLENIFLKDDEKEKAILECLKNGKFAMASQLANLDNEKEVVDAIKYLYMNEKKVTFEKIKNQKAKEFLELAFEKWNEPKKTTISQFWKKGYDCIKNPLFNSVSYKILFAIETEVVEKKKNTSDRKNAKEIFEKCLNYFSYDKKLKEKTIQILQNYYDIKTYRNSANHAGILANSENKNISQISKEVIEKVTEHINLLINVKKEG